MKSLRLACLALWLATVAGRAADPLVAIAQSPALIAAQGERVFALLASGRFHALEGATGKPVLEFADAGKPTTVMLLDGGQLLLADDTGLQAYDAATARPLWRAPADRAHTLVAGGGEVFYLEEDDRTGATVGELSSRDATTGKLRWKKPFAWGCRTELASFGEGRIVFEVRRPATWQATWRNPARRKEDDFQLAVVNVTTGTEERRRFGVGSSARHGEFTTAFWHKGQLLTEARTPNGLGIAVYNPGQFEKPFETFRAVKAVVPRGVSTLLK